MTDGMKEGMKGGMKGGMKRGNIRKGPDHVQTIEREEMREIRREREVTLETETETMAIEGTERSAKIE